MNKILVNLLQRVRNISITEDLEEVKVLSNIVVTEESEQVVITGLNENLEEDFFVIANINSIKEDFDGMEVFISNKQLLIEGF